MLDELLIGGEMVETSKKNILKAITAQDILQDVSVCCHVGPLLFCAWVRDLMATLNLCAPFVCGSVAV